MDVQKTTPVRPERDEELRIEAESRAAGGAWAYAGTRECPACEGDAPPLHPDGSDRQTCRHCGMDLPGDPVTWAIREDSDRGPMFILRHGDYCQAVGAPQRTGDDEIDAMLASNVWLNLEHSLQLLTFYNTKA